MFYIGKTGRHLFLRVCENLFGQTTVHSKNVTHVVLTIFSLVKRFSTRLDGVHMKNIG